MNTQTLSYAAEALKTLPHIELEIARPGAFQLGTVRFLRGQRSPVEGCTAHDAKEISLILKGKLEVVADGKKHIVEAGALLEIPTGETHYARALEDSEILYVLVPD